MPEAPSICRLLLFAIFFGNPISSIQSVKAETSSETKASGTVRAYYFVWTGKGGLDDRINRGANLYFYQDGVLKDLGNIARDMSFGAQLKKNPIYFKDVELAPGIYRFTLKIQSNYWDFDVKVVKNKTSLLAAYPYGTSSEIGGTLFHLEAKYLGVFTSPSEDLFSEKVKEELNSPHFAVRINALKELPDDPAYNELILSSRYDLDGRVSLFANELINNRKIKAPSVKKIMKQHEKMFDCNFSLPSGWKHRKSGTKYFGIFKPKNDDQKVLGMEYIIDLLIPELQQAVTSLDEYIDISFLRLKRAGYNVDKADKFTRLSIDENFKGFLIDGLRDKEKKIFLFRKLDSRFAVVYTITIFEPFEDVFEKYHQDIETIINNAVITTR